MEKEASVKTRPKKEGWGWPANTRKAHYFVESRSLCGRWLFFGELENFSHNSPSNCLPCRRKREKLESVKAKKQDRARRKFQRMEQGYQGSSPLPPSYSLKGPRERSSCKDFDKFGSSFEDNHCQKCDRYRDCVREYAKKVIERRLERCPWRCPLCKRQCGGVKGHKGEHQCPRHYKGKKRRPTS